MILKYKGVTVCSVCMLMSLGENICEDLVNGVDKVNEVLKKYRVGAEVDYEESTIDKVFIDLKLDIFEDTYYDDIAMKSLCKVAKAYMVTSMYFANVRIILLLKDPIKDEGPYPILGFNDFIDLCKWQMSLYNEEV